MNIHHVVYCAVFGVGTLVSRAGTPVPSHTHASAVPHVSSISHTSSARARFVVDSTGATGRVVVGEYLTGTFCPGCQAHEQAFDSLLHQYPSTQFIALAYHGSVNYPIADPADSVWERMYSWYGQAGRGREKGLFPNQYHDDWIDGHGTMDNMLSLSGEDLRPKYYRAMVNAIETELHKAPEAVLHVEATPHGGTLQTRVHVESLAPNRAETYVRILVVEDTVRLQRAPQFDKGGPYPRVEHYMVVRAFAHDATHVLGLPLTGPGTVSYTFDLAQAQARLLRWWQLGMGAAPGSQEKETAEDVKQMFSIFSDKANWLIHPSHLHVVAFVQDAHTGEVLQAAMIPVAAGSNGTPLKLL